MTPAEFIRAQKGRPFLSSDFRNAMGVNARGGSNMLLSLIMRGIIRRVAVGQGYSIYQEASQ